MTALARIERATAWRKEIPGRILVGILLSVALIAPVGVGGVARAGGSCDRSVSWKDVPAAATGNGGIDSIQVTSSTGKLSGTLFVRVDVDPGIEIDRLLIDSDEDWMTGMWTSQSDISAAGWDRLIDAWSGLYSHQGDPRKWKWNRLDSSTSVERASSGFRYCIPIGALGLGNSKRLRIAAETEEISLPLRFVPGVPFPPTDDGPEGEAVEVPERMVFNYSGIPWSVRKCADKLKRQKGCAAKAYSRFGHLILGARLEEPDRSGHDGTTQLIRKMKRRAPDTEVWGYISIIGSPKDSSGVHPVVYSVDDYLDHVRAWAEMGVTGIFIDEYDVCDPSYERCQEGPAGPVAITREHQRRVVDGIHALGLAAFVNGHSPMDAMASYMGAPSPLGDGDGERPADMYLLENPTVLDGGYHTGIDFEANLAKFMNAIRFKQDLGVRIGVLDSMPGVIPDQASGWPTYQLGWWRAAQANADGYAFFSTAVHDGKVPILAPPPGALVDARASFEANGIEALSNGWETNRYVEDCTGARIGSVTVERLSADGTAVGGFVRTAASDPSC